MSQSSHYLKVTKNGTTYNIALYDSLSDVNNNGLPVKIGGQQLYAALATDGDTPLCVKKYSDGVTYKAKTTGHIYGKVTVNQGTQTINVPSGTKYIWFECNEAKKFEYYYLNLTEIGSPTQLTVTLTCTKTSKGKLIRRVYFSANGKQGWGIFSSDYDTSLPVSYGNNLADIPDDYEKLTWQDV